MDKTVKPMICTDKERFRGILINLLSFIIGNLTTNQIIIQIKYKSPSEICVIFKKTLKSTKDSQSKRDILELKKYIDNKLLTYQINNKLSSLLGKDRTKGLELLVIKDHEEENPNELFHFCLYNQDK
jgi:hypothetical protein